MYSGAKQRSSGIRILVVRLSAMGDIIHALPAVASLKHSFPGSHLTWAVAPQWAPLLESNPFVDRLLVLERASLCAIIGSWKQLRAGRYDAAIDFQGLVQSALVASLARPDRIYGFHSSLLREKAAALFYSSEVLAQTAHVVDQNLELASAAGAASILRTFPLPDGHPEGALPEGDFVLASPLAGWPSKQWPLAFYGQLAERIRRELRMPLVLNGPQNSAGMLSKVPEVVLHISGIAGLIHATRQATLVVGVDSGPLHLAAALGKIGVALFGPTDPARNGPYGEGFTVLRSPLAVTSHKRGSGVDQSMSQISPDLVFEALRAQYHRHSHSAGCVA